MAKRTKKTAIKATAKSSARPPKKGSWKDRGAPGCSKCRYIGCGTCFKKMNGSATDGTKKSAADKKAKKEEGNAIVSPEATTVALTVLETGHSEEEAKQFKTSVLHAKRDLEKKANNKKAKPNTPRKTKDEEEQDSPQSKNEEVQSPESDALVI